MGAREDEGERAHKGQGWARGREQRGGAGRVASRIAPHRARASQKAEVRKRRRENRSMLNADLMHG